MALPGFDPMCVRLGRPADDYPSWPATYGGIVAYMVPLVLAQVAGTGPGHDGKSSPAMTEKERRV
jgi:hypothetical protein